MAFELVAARLLAPSIGSSIYVWTNVIGIMIAALALGYAAGGVIADTRNRKSDILWLFLLSATGIALVAILHQTILSTITTSLGDARLQGLVASLVLFAPPSFVLGTISPYLARLKLHSLETTGRSIAGLSAANSLGGIAGTFCTGFLFFSVIGSVETLTLLTTILIVCSWLIVPAYRFAVRAGISIILLICIVASLSTSASANTIAEIDTPSAHYKIIDVTLQNRPVRVLTMGPAGWQSGTYQDGSKELVFAYTHKITDIVAAAPHKDRILILGGGAFSLPEYLGTHYPESTVDVVEIDPLLPDIAKQYFGFKQPSNVQIFTQDGRTYLNNTTNRYDIVIADVYNDISVPFALTTQEYTEALRSVTSLDGVAIANLIAANNQNCKPLLASINRSYAAAFNNSHYYPLHDPEMAVEQNIIGLYSNTSLAWSSNIPGSVLVKLTEGRRLSDNFAPIEILKQRCSQS